MTGAKLGRLEKLDPRDIWATETGDFTPWLARAENLTLLGETIGLELELEATERNVGAFRADILCKDTDTGHWVLIENQLGRTDHGHLGQLLTYASGLEAVTIVWIAASFTDEHRAALDWLNQITDDRFAFFGLEVELWRIGDSLAAPKFNIISKPNAWSRSVSQAASAIAADTLTDTKALQLDYWTRFRDHLLLNHSPIRPQKPYPQLWMYFGIGRSGFKLMAVLNSVDDWIGVNLVIDAVDATAFFHLLHERKEEIEAAVGTALDWRDLPDKKSCRILLRRPGANPLDQTAWPDYMAWMRDKLERFAEIFGPRLRALNAADWKPAAMVVDDMA
ncbi:DUF4268 domain-containing protein [Azospirillum cavernae]|uniref:DUF4268 domain-containing protein n=1 Tax=Azospirillum cavernae TaxID=2320860 RepID=A0A418VY07_9PROT|nr:DUF4268 domain-containing protein [Azospirillum cavernae]RJF82063.1 DUF4268 domain-containing protein [Azospirillum cavernae]